MKGRVASKSGGVVSKAGEVASRGGRVASKGGEAASILKKRTTISLFPPVKTLSTMKLTGKHAFFCKKPYNT
ncbi:hypothetical protein C2I17_16920 [Niallia circulans]|uniref:hypothetical protein n=1 Tax=Niallia circulans TaxID=1397 RepID=UPI00201D8C68|nr:hypothetical protein [Niallia circulans]UQZ76101.1 hypothetical protein C2I17_16920 [Niallia circulans]